MNRYAILENGVVINVILWDGEAEWVPLTGTTANLLPNGSSVGPGWTFDGTNYADPVGTIA